ncbi:hypothetical protein FNV43_RR09663 [Rhamnella rubrinervis]|uniref:Uncharacterized protein n=1 Tax=Rhamnella rubrinervis TaxID=2594499 RepID=A0A8K0HAU5_9ROSA|nr:hypothetical protein FNV43_RR09663 [Rhamnella rubrinervis]
MADEGSNGTIPIAIEQRFEKKKKIWVFANPRIVERRKRLFKGRVRLEIQTRSDEGIDHEMGAGGKIRQAAAPIFREGNEVVDSLKAINVQIKEPTLEINQGMEDYEKDCRLVVEQHVFDVEYKKVEVLGQEKTFYWMSFCAHFMFTVAILVKGQRN